MTIIHTWSQQRKSRVTVRWIEQRKTSFLETCAKKYKEMDTSKKKQCLKNRREKYEQMDVSQKKTIVKQNC